MDDQVIKTIIIDDEEESRNILRRLLTRAGGIEIEGEAPNAGKGFELILEKDPDLIFLDIQMPEKNGFDLIRMLAGFNIKAKVIFVTAHNEFAIHAVKVAAFDYLLKPVVFEELKETLSRFRLQRQHEPDRNRIDRLLELLEKSGKISFNTRTGYIFVAPDDILFCQADINYTDIHFSSCRREVVTVNIGKVEEMLGSKKFFRISRSHLINTEYLTKADRKSKTCELIKGQDKFHVPAPLKQIRLLEELLKKNWYIHHHKNHDYE
jgi:two-component system LytT family response regulator